MTKASKILKMEDNQPVQMYELHVDFDGLQDIANVRYELGGILSNQSDPNKKPIIMFGKDECIFQKYLSKGKQWCGPNGERALMPKTDGYGIMVSLTKGHRKKYMVPPSSPLS